MTKKEFIQLFGEDPVDVFGNDWRNDLDYWLNAFQKTSENENKYEEAQDMAQEKERNAE